LITAEEDHPRAIGARQGAHGLRIARIVPKPAAMRSLRPVLAALLFPLGCAGSAPAPSNEATSEPAPSEIARVHHARCGACHQRVESGQRSRAELEAALSRHHKRVHLTDEQWAAMIDYLAAR
jgi:hypothetical protein